MRGKLASRSPADRRGRAATECGLRTARYPGTTRTTRGARRNVPAQPVTPRHIPASRRIRGRERAQLAEKLATPPARPPLPSRPPGAASLAGGRAERPGGATPRSAARRILPAERALSVERTERRRPRCAQTTEYLCNRAILSGACPPRPHPRGGARLRAHRRLGRRAAPVAAQRAGGGRRRAADRLAGRAAPARRGPARRRRPRRGRGAPPRANTVSTLVGGLVAAGPARPPARPRRPPRRAAAPHARRHDAPAPLARRARPASRGRARAPRRGGPSRRLEASLPALERLLAALERDR